MSSAKGPRQHVPGALYAKRWNLDKTDHKLPTGSHTKGCVQHNRVEARRHVGTLSLTATENAERCGRFLSAGRKQGMGRKEYFAFG